MAVQNGKLPDNLLSSLPWPEASHLRCRTDAAESLGRLAAAFEAHFGKPLLLSDGYRTFAEQVALKKIKKNFAAKPGTSNHGLGVAIDAASRINVDGSDEHKWMEANGPSFGWINPEWAVNFDSSDGEHEPWHWEYHPELDGKPAAGAMTALALPIPEDDMPYTPEQLRGEVKTAIAEMLLEVAEGETTYGRTTAVNLLGATRVTAHRTLTAMANRSDPTGRQMADLLRSIVVADTPDAVVQAIPDEFVQAVIDGLNARLRT